jgi:hypothetical protein
LFLVLWVAEVPQRAPAFIFFPAVLRRRRKAEQERERCFAPTKSQNQSRTQASLIEHAITAAIQRARP